MKENSMQQTVVIGAGLMGIGIATHFARFHQDVLIYDTDPARLAEVAGAASAILSELRDAGQFSDADKPATLARLHVTTSLDDLADARLLIEAIPERLELKHALYAELEKRIAPDAIIASNTSGLPPDALAANWRIPNVC
jgi:3-hydroxybutyryl-CoA dehydrogenase